MRASSIVFLCTAGLAALLNDACRSNQAERDFLQARARLLETSMKADSAGIVAARQSFEKLLQSEQVTRNDSLAAWTHYYIAFANWQLALPTMGNRPNALKLVKEALVQAAAATKLRENLFEAYSVQRRSQYWIFMLDPKHDRSFLAESRAAFQKAQALAPNHPVIMMEEAIELYYKPAQAGGDQQKGLERFQAALQQFKLQKEMEPSQARWWQATTHVMYGQAQLGVGRVAAAEEEFQAALKLEPNFEYVKTTMLPMTQLVAAPAISALTHASWINLAHDSETDGFNPAWAAVKTLSYFYDAATDTIWFKLDLSRLPNPDAFGINLVVDTDQNQSTGSNWWGGNRAFKYDRLVSVWVVKDGANVFRGAVGVGDFHGVNAGRYTNLYRNNLAFRADSISQTMLLGMKRTELDDDGRMNLIAAVGSNAGWNDDVPDSNSVQLDLK
ncbi:hypothetical protein HUU05_02560 [candidate division KSB1 bacterium]|nr:hypothetical protein [candidate division KSB1 bacterium]